MNKKLPPPWPLTNKAPPNDDHMLERFLKPQATAPSTQWETRYKALVGALLEACEEADRSYTNNAVDTDYLRETIERNP